MVCDAMNGVGGDIAKELVNRSCGVVGGRSLLQADGAQGYKRFIVHCTSIVQKGTYNTLDAFDAGIIKRGAGVNLWE